MSDELRRILALVKQGKLTEEQAAEMIEALDDEDQAEAGDDAADEFSGQGRTRRRGHRRDDSEALEELGLTIGKEVASIVDKSLKGLSSALNGRGKRRHGRGRRSNWLNDSNVNVLSKLHTPSGENYECRDNRFTVSRLDDVHLAEATFSDNETHAGSIKGVSIQNGHFNGNQLRGSSLKGITIDTGDFTNCQLNGSQVTAVAIDEGKLDDCSFNGTQARDLAIDGGTLSASLFNGAKLADVDIGEASTVRDFTVNGSRVQDLTVEHSNIDKVRLNGVSMDTVGIDHTTLSNVIFRNREWREYIGHSGRLPTPTITDLTLRNLKCTNTKFIGCTFSNTEFRDCEIADMTFTDVDFSDLTLDSTDAIAALADQHEAA